jgi:diacylglycerol kinase family enzyme
MHKAALLYNPLSGCRHDRRLADVKAAASVLRDAGVELLITPTQAAPGTAAQVREAISQGCETVIACGGDGTVHDVLQSLVGSDTALAIIPLGTANALAHDLRIPLTPVSAARAALTANPRRIAVGQVRYQDLLGNPASQYFTVTLGIGADAHLFHELDSSVKIRFGMLAYYAKATWHCRVCRGRLTNADSGGFRAVGRTHSQLWRSAARACSGRFPRPRRFAFGALSYA